MKIFSTILVIFIVSIFLVQKFSNMSAAPISSDISYEAVQQNKAIVLDVREQEEIEQGMIKGALWYPTSKIESDKSEQLSKIKQAVGDKTVFVYCKSGGRAGRITDDLNEAGVHAKNVGGYQDLVKKGFPVKDMRQSEPGRISE